ncbi:hypothetical protein DFQ11_1069 [Winogradskyella epiphytica]|uniref:Phosphoribosylpyrophosphate synthetase n=1 Tax=Winogradskyella epiphytica TaxID=262005 RepID=A0A2V4YB05_9FLAO|nr:hypothetical protein [Winogradskyella epiphytica]PYE80212.1 hypothetical protein DFQ11_1069 [Winogradskyella epiphytica]GGW69798.1 hypothetical protein GCM10008085_22140 [Winogradskyella epiphytica]
MNNEYSKHEKDNIKIYEEKGYTAGFHFKEGNLIGNNSKHVYTPKDINIVAEHRYEGISNPDDMSILYIIETSKGEKGTFLLGYGPNADLELAEFFKNIPEKNISDRKNINS